MYAFGLAWHSVRFMVVAHGSEAQARLLGEDKLEYSIANLVGQAEKRGGCSVALHAFPKFQPTDDQPLCG